MKKIELPVFIVVVLYFYSCSGQKTENHPNIILIMADDQGWGDLSINGNKNIETSNIDKLAQEGVVFKRFYVSPVSSPTRAELLTGRYHVRGGVSATGGGGERLNLNEHTIAEIFKSAGYSTAAYGKWHNGMQSPYHPNARGFDDFYGFCSGHCESYFDPLLEHNGKMTKRNGYIIDDLTDHALQFIELKQETPFFLYLPFNTPHAPMQVPDYWWDQLSDKTIILENDENELFTRAALAMCLNIDWNVGRIMSKIEELNLSDNTIILYMSDNGPNNQRWNGGMKGKKGSTDEGGVRSPMFIKWNKYLKSSQVIEEIGGAIDLLPTLVDLANISVKYKNPIDGKSLKPLVTGKKNEWKDRMIFSYWNKRLSIRNQKYVLDADNNLYDIENDPGQNMDISDKNPDIKDQFIEAKRKWEKEVLVELPINDTRPFLIGQPGFSYSPMLAQDGIAHGNIRRSSHWPYRSFFTNWIDREDSITWNVEVIDDGIFDVEIFYTCPKNETGSTFEISFNGTTLLGSISEPNNPPLTGMENDRTLRSESYAKDFKALKVGSMPLRKGRGVLKLQATHIIGSQVMDFQSLLFTKID